ncbi:cytosol aminopeptidase [Stanieria cyanosphaera PCC 7437]|uniref:Probable cytosol aminopeptidase n=1 Tax=Stanieria cyanosphaera (strain ATCC 29371 / PCC 7437) TaxID=111780 RepID=K9XND5_STAC7|nr:leucyl aminopeptidase [Stanieria cyanosphaera]AFZ34110.1 cytosol aminopeptidase [Stanieria cyanosphaera PCC 7437]
MQILATDRSLLDWTGDTLAIGIFEGQTELTGELAQLNEQLAGTIQELIAVEEFEGKSGTTAVTRLMGNSSLRKLILVGLGKSDKFKLENYQNTAATVVRLAKKDHSLAISFPIQGSPDAVAQTMTEGILLALHQDNRFKSEPEEKEIKLETIDLLGLNGQDAAIKRAEIVASGVILARELVNAPANEVTPLTMAATAEAIASEYGLSLEILEQEDCEQFEQGMGAFLGVAKASDIPPKFIHLTYKPTETPKRKVAIVGKSLTFDSGGLNLKVSGSGIETMKMDMGGGAATLGAAKAIAQLKPNVEVHFICAATENMISGRAMHPGDILKAANGKTIEVNNTDAEGRLTLADALIYAEKLGLDAIVDLATLTGACIIALGDQIAGLWSTDDDLANQIKTAAELAGEKFWQMPLEEPYFDGMKSAIADMKNTGPRAGGSITAALFLKQFIKDTPWVHLDIAGPVWTDKPNGVNNVGATGFPVRTLVNWILNS